MKITSSRWKLIVSEKVLTHLFRSSELCVASQIFREITLLSNEKQTEEIKYFLAINFWPLTFYVKSILAISKS